MSLEVLVVVVGVGVEDGVDKVTWLWKEKGKEGEGVS